MKFRLFGAPVVKAADAMTAAEHFAEMREAVRAVKAEVDACTAAIERAWISKYLVRKVDRSGATLGYILRDEQADETPLLTREKAEALALAILRHEKPELFTRTQSWPDAKLYMGSKALGVRPDPYGPDDDATIVAPGVGGVPLDDESVNADPALAGQQRPRHGTLDGKRLFSRRKNTTP